MTLTRKINLKINVGLLFPLLVLAAIGIVSYRSNLQMARDAAWVDHSHRVLYVLLEVRTGIERTQTDERTTLRAGRQPSPVFAAAGAQLRVDLGRLRDLAEDNPRQQERLAAMEPLVERQFTPQPGGWSVSRGDAVELDTRLATLLDAMETEESARLARRSQRTEVSAQANQRLLVVCGAVALALGWLAAWTIHRDLRLRQQAERALERAHEVLERTHEVLERTHGELEEAHGQLRKVNGGLEQRILERTAELASAHDALASAHDALASAHDALASTHNALADAYDTTIDGWGRALDLRDHETEGHSRRVTEMTLRLAAALGIAGEDLHQVRRGAALHDIGKMGVPDSILLKPGPLDDEEWAVMRRHPTLAYEMLWPVAFLRPALDIPLCHHERWDGTGYPSGLRGEAIPLAARVFAVVDVWDALRSDRPYRRGWPAEKVFAHIESLSGTHFDPDVVRAFLAMTEGERREAEVSGRASCWRSVARTASGRSRESGPLRLPQTLIPQALIPQTLIPQTPIGGMKQQMRTP